VEREREREIERARERERERSSHTAPSALTPAGPTLTTDVSALTTGAAANGTSVVAAAVADREHVLCCEHIRYTNGASMVAAAVAAGSQEGVEGVGGGEGASCHIAEPPLKRLKT
jgi:hypothetical protein